MAVTPRIALSNHVQTKITRRNRARRGAVVTGVGLLTGAVLVGQAPAAFAAAPSASSPVTSRTDSQQPQLAVTTADPDGGSVTARFFARRTGSGTWDLANGTAVAATAGATARLVLPSKLKIGQRFEWAAQVCDATTCSALTALSVARVSPTLGAGSRPNATTLSFPLDDGSQAQVDVGTGNLLVTSNQLTLPGVTADVPVGLTFNSLSLGTDATSQYNAAGQGWTVSPLASRLVDRGGGAVAHHDASGTTGLFLIKTGSTTAYASPTGLKADLVKTATGWTLTDRQSRQVQTFDAAGALTATADRNGNTTTVTAAGSGKKITASRGVTAARAATLAYDGYRFTGISQATTPARTVGLNVDTTGAYYRLAGVTDATGQSLTFGYESVYGATTGDLTSVTNGAGDVVEFAFDTDHRVTTITQRNTATGSPGASVTRLSYATSTQTLVADPNTDQAQAVSAVPRTTYDLVADGTGRVATSTDPTGRRRAATYTPQQDVASATSASGTAQAGTSTYGYGANNGESQTSSASPAGATSTATYANTGANAYQPSALTDSAGSSTTLTYNGAGNRTATTDANASNAQVTYNTDGTVATSTDPANGTNASRYAYDTNKQLGTVTAPTGSGLGARGYTWDGLGRLATAGNGAGVTATYTYDQRDRVTRVAFSDATPAVSFAYDGAGRVRTRIDGSGTTTYGYDGKGQLTSIGNTAGGGTIAYGYDKAGALSSTTDSRGTNTYTYDAAQALTGMTVDGGTKKILFANDGAGRRTDTWLDANPDHTLWKVHSHQDYDASGRVTRSWADKGTGDTAATRVFDMSYCYAAASTAPACSATKTDDRGKVQWVKNNISGLVVAYSYDAGGRLTKAAGSGTTTAKTHTYTYDANGNRRSAGDGTTTQSLTYNSGNQLTTAGYAYDGAGNQTADPTAGTLGYDGAGRMTSATKGSTSRPYAYAGLGQHEVLSTTGSDGINNTLTYGRADDNGLPIIEQVARNGYRAYVEHDPSGSPVALRTSAGTEVLYVYDGLGNPIGLVNDRGETAAGYSYDPYGAQSTDTYNGGNADPQNPYTFQQGLKDQTTGFIKYGARFYNPTTGRFTQQDSLLHLADPTQGNRYAYAGADPINNADPLGTDACGNAIIGFGVGVGGFLGGTAAIIGAPLTGGTSTVLAVGLYELSALGVGSAISGLENC